VIVKTAGDRAVSVPLERLDDVGFFTKELEVALADGRCDLAVPEAKKARVLYNVVDAPRHYTYFTPAVVERGALQIASCSGGQSPVLSGRLRRILDDALPQSASDWTALFGKLRALEKGRSRQHGPTERAHQPVH